MAFVIAPISGNDIPFHEQVLNEGAALGNFLFAAYAFGYGAIILSEERCKDTYLCRAIEVNDSDALAGLAWAPSKQRRLYDGFTIPISYYRCGAKYRKIPTSKKMW